MLLRENILTKPIVEETDRTKLPETVLCRVTYNVCNIGEKNANKRVYEQEVWDNVLADETLKEMLESRRLFGQAEHPVETQSDLQLTSHVIHSMWIGERTNNVWQTMDVLDTPMGRIVDSLIRAGCGVGVSTRAEGDLEESEDEEGKFSRVIPEAYRYITTDFTADPSTFGVFPQDVRRNVVSAVQTEMVNESATKEERDFARTFMENLRCQKDKNDESCSGCGCCKALEEKKDVSKERMYNDEDVRTAQSVYFEAIESGLDHSDAVDQATKSVEGRIHPEDIERILRRKGTMERLIKEDKIKEGQKVHYKDREYEVEKVDEAAQSITLRPDIENRGIEVEQDAVIITGSPIITVGADGTITITPVPTEMVPEPVPDEELPVEEEPEPELEELEPDVEEKCGDKHKDKKGKKEVEEGMDQLVARKEELVAKKEEGKCTEEEGKELEEIEAKLKEMDVDVEEKARAAHEKVEGTADFRKKLDRASSKVEQLEADLSSAKAEAKRLQDELENMTKQKEKEVDIEEKDVDVDGKASLTEGGVSAVEQDESKDLRIKEAITRAEKEKALERIEEISESIGSLKHESSDSKLKLKMIMGKMKEATAVYDEINGLRSKLEEKARAAHEKVEGTADFRKKLDRASSKVEQLEADLSSAKAEAKRLQDELENMTKQKERISESNSGRIKTVKEEYERKLTKAKSQGLKEGTTKVLSDYVNRRLLELDLSIGENTRALLDDCESIKDVEDVLEKTKDMQRRDALHSEPIEEIRVRNQQIDPEQAKVDKEVGIAFDGM